MIVGIPNEIINNENRVAITPNGVRGFVDSGHEVRVETQAGVGSGFEDADYLAAGATICEQAAEVWASEMVMKVKEPQPSEYQYLREDLILYAYLHLAPAKELTEVLRQTGTISIAYETMQMSDGSLPLLIPMSEIAGRMSVQTAAHFLEKAKGGKGLLLPGIPGVKRGNVVIIGGGTAGMNAAKIAVGIGANVTLLDISQKRLGELDNIFGNSIQTLVSNPYTIADATKEADVVIGAVLIPGAKSPSLVSREMVAEMEDGSVIIDIAIDQGGIFETIDHTTSHDDPVYEREGVLHYAVPNMPGAVAKTSTIALTNQTLPYALKIAADGLPEAAIKDSVLRAGINTYKYKITCEAVANSQTVPYTDIKELFYK